MKAARDILHPSLIMPPCLNTAPAGKYGYRGCQECRKSVHRHYLDGPLDRLDLVHWNDLWIKKMLEFLLNIKRK
jgi:hypothetical protein